MTSLKSKTISAPLVSVIVSLGAILAAVSAAIKEDSLKIILLATALILIFISAVFLGIIMVKLKRNKIKD